MTIRITCLLKRAPNMTHEQFSEHWSKNHAHIFTNLDAVKKNLVRYNQFHVLPQYNETFESMGLPIAPFDGAAEFYVEKLDNLLALFGDEQYQKNAIPDEKNFLDRNSVQIMIGEDKVDFRPSKR
ncbi:hypothetical protein BT96DRAFT_891349 [Gymnopus androsaceus JB14]|uniref:EthD domain-containing protein n=1 Tax=Gymnopus androsaceus JB14 TaxID=1447944 RepID=A0A6A4GNG2_9AGAR|nr:hypothetical protein BT96DRAFT_891349 [Gymnopus androsaceus JB14]